MAQIPLVVLGALGLATIVSATGSAADRVRMDLRLDLEAGAVEGTVHLDYRNDSGGPLEEVRLRLDPNLVGREVMEIRSVTDASGGALEWRPVPFTWGKFSSDRAQMAVTPAKPLLPGESATLVLEFRAAERRAIQEEMIVLQDDPYPSFDAWYPKAMSYRGGAWSVDDDRPSDYEVTFDAPAGFQFATTGTLREEPAETEGRVVRKLRAEGVRGFTFYGRKDWAVHAGEAHGVEIRCFVPQEDDAWGPRLLEAMADTLGYYIDRYGSYPTRHLDLMTIRAEQGGGAFACANVIGMLLGPGIEDQYRWLVAHEVAHQYFGNLVNQTRHEVYWVIIGLGMVVDREYMLDRDLGDAMHRQMIGMCRMAMNLGRDTTLSQPVSNLLTADPPWSAQWNLALGHAKAYAVCAMLEDLTGRDRFAAVVRDLLETEGGRMITASDVVERCEKAGAGDLDWFVADWIDGDVKLDHAVTRVERKGRLWEVEVKRVGEAAYPRVVEVETESGKKLRKRVDRAREVQVLEFETDEALVLATIDPDGIYPDMDPKNDRWTP